jgi:predicted nuclease with TOPRIM domain
VEASLHQQIANLQADLDEQKKLLNKHQKAQEQAKQLKAELEQAKKAAMQLAEANSKLIEEANALHKAPQAAQPQKHKTSERVSNIFSEPPTDEPADFAAKSWLL